MDMRGFNDSEKPSGIESYFIMNMVNDIKELVSGLGKKKFTLVSHDWGGAISWAYAAHYPETLDNLIFCNMPHVAAFNEARKKSLDQMEEEPLEAEAEAETAELMAEMELAEG